MKFTCFDLIWLFFLYSFLGWVLETVVAACKQKRFVNKGLINLPFCISYGLVEVFLTIFCGELQGFWFYLGAVIWINVFKWMSGFLIEKVSHKRWWDYSDRRWNIEGYVSPIASALLGLLFWLAVKKGNFIFIEVFHLMPEICRIILVWAVGSCLFLDAMATLIVLGKRDYPSKPCEKLERRFDKFTGHISDRIYVWIEKRVNKAYPDAKKVEPHTDENVFASGCCFYKIVWLFFIGSFLGDIVETIFCRLTAGVWMSRSSVVWGPFSIVWGLAIAGITLLLYKYQKKPDRALFLAGTFLGGAYEYICSVFTEIMFGKVFWDYSNIHFNLGGRINLLYCFFWGIAAVIWLKGIYPVVSGWIEKIPVKPGKILSWIMIVFMCCNMIVSSMALIRSDQRKENIPATSSWQKLMDDRFADQRMQKIYPNAINVSAE